MSIIKTITSKIRGFFAKPRPMHEEFRDSVILQNEGQRMFCVLHMPKVKGKVPCVLMCHGFAGHKVGKFRLYVELSRRLSEMGIASFRMDFRGSGDSEGDFDKVTLGGQLSDALVGVEFLKNHPGIDPNRIGIFGRSMGGLIGMLTAAKCPEIKSMALWAPVYSGEQWKEMWKVIQEQDLSNEEREEMMRFDGQLPGVELFHELFALQPDEHILNVKAKDMLHVSGGKDQVLNEGHTECYTRFRKDAPAKSRFLRLPNSDHYFSHPAEQKLAIDETVEWFEKTL